MTDYPPDEFDRKHGITAAWGRGARGQGVTVAVVDEALDPVSPHLVGYVDEVVDFQGGVVPRADSHGTKIARLIRMFAPDCRIIGLNIFPDSHGLSVNDYNQSVRAAATKAVRYCQESSHDISVINMSFDVPRGRTLGFGGCRPSHRCSLCTAVNDVRARGILPVVAAGNRGPQYDTMECPAVAEGAYTVGALLSKEDTRAFEASVPNERHRFGTSWAAAYTAGGIAALMSVCSKASLNEILHAYAASCSPLAGQTTLGRANLTLAVANLIGVEKESLDVCWQRVVTAKREDWAKTIGKDGAKLRDAVDLLLLHARKGLLRIGDVVEARALLDGLDRYVPWNALPIELRQQAETIRSQLGAKTTS